MFALRQKALFPLLMTTEGLLSVVLSVLFGEAHLFLLLDELLGPAHTCVAQLIIRHGEKCRKEERGTCVHYGAVVMKGTLFSA